MSYDAPIDSPYDATQTTLDPETPALDEVILQLLDEHGARLRVALPAQVVAVGGNQTVDLQPMLMGRNKNATTPLTLPILQGVPVVMPLGQNYSVKVPIAVGDNGLALFCDRSLDAWGASNGQAPVDPQDTRTHDLSDAVWLPGLVPQAQQTQDTTTDLVIKAGQAQLRLLQNGKVVLGAPGGELLNVLDQTLQAMESLCNALAGALVQVTAPSTPAPFAPSTITQLTQLGTTLTQLQGTLDGIKGQ